MSIALCLALAACGAVSPPGVLPAPQIAATPAQAVLVTLGDSITAMDSPTSKIALPSEQFPTLLAADLHATLYDLAIGGETASYYAPFRLVPDGNVIGPKQAMATDEMPNFPAACAQAGSACYVTIYIGTNDQSIAGAPASGWSSVAVAAAYAQSVPAAVNDIRARAPQADIIIATVPNHDVVRMIPPAIPYPNPDNKAIFAMVRSFKATITAIKGISVVDLLCEPGMYDPHNFNGQIDVHPNKYGHRIIEQDFLVQIQHPTRPGTCAFENAL